MPEAQKLWSFPLAVGPSPVIIAEMTTLLPFPVATDTDTCSVSGPRHPHHAVEVHIYVKPALDSIPEVCDPSTGHIYTAIVLFDQHNESAACYTVVRCMAATLSAYIAGKNKENITLEALLGALQRDPATRQKLQQYCQQSQNQSQHQYLTSILAARLPHLSNAKLRCDTLNEMQQLMEALNSMTAASIAFLQALAHHLTDTLERDSNLMETMNSGDVDSAKRVLSRAIRQGRASGNLYTKYGVEKVLELRTALELAACNVLCTDDDAKNIENGCRNWIGKK